MHLLAHIPSVARLKMLRTKKTEPSRKEVLGLPPFSRAPLGISGHFLVSHICDVYIYLNMGIDLKVVVQGFIFNCETFSIVSDYTRE